jgi:tubulin---tyrosine ligase
LREILGFLASKSQNTFWVVQKYIEKPLLYNGRKFDIRIWAIFTGNSEVFIYKRAYVRTSSDSYDLNNQNNYVHLTNQCLQVHGDGYGKHEDGNTLALHDLDAYFKEIYPDYNIKVDTHVKPRMVDLILDTFHCYQKQLNPNRRKNVFELFGYDFLIDEDMRTWLIEVNTNPHLGTQNKYMEKLVPEMLTDMISLVVDPILPPRTPFYRGKIYFREFNL